MLEADAIEEFVELHMDKMDELQWVREALSELVSYHATQINVSGGHHFHNPRVRIDRIRRRCCFCGERSKGTFYLGDTLCESIGNPATPSVHFHPECLFLEEPLRDAQELIRSAIQALLDQKKERERVLEVRSSSKDILDVIKEVT